VRLASTLFVLFLARRLGAEEFGRYSSAVAFAAICIVLVDLGTGAILTREIARHPESRHRMADASHLLKLAASLFSWIVLLAATYLFKFRPDQRTMTLSLGVVAIGQTLTEYFGSLLNGIEEMGWEAALKTISRLLSLSLGFVALFLRQSLPAITLSM